ELVVIPAVLDRLVVVVLPCPLSSLAVDVQGVGAQGAGRLVVVPTVLVRLGVPAVGELVVLPAVLDRLVVVVSLCPSSSSLSLSLLVVAPEVVGTLLVVPAVLDRLVVASEVMGTLLVIAEVVGTLVVSQGVAV